jgi:hypothetical protein
MSANFAPEPQVVERWDYILRSARGQAGHQEHDDRAAAKIATYTTTGDLTATSVSVGMESGWPDSPAGCPNIRKLARD